MEITRACRRATDSGQLFSPARWANQVWPALRSSKLVLAAVGFLIFLTVVAIFAPLIAPESYGGYDFMNGGLHPQLDWRYLLGSDVAGHSVLSYVIYGARTTPGIALLATAVALAGGGTIATLATYAPGWVRSGLLFAVDGATMLPFLPLLLVLAAFAAGGNPWGIAVIFGLVAIPVVVAGLFATAPDKTRPGALRSSGRSGWMWNLVRLAPRTPEGKVVRLGTLLLSAFIVSSATIDFLGFGLPPSNPSWGNALSTVANYLDAGYWWWLFFPGLAIFNTVLAVNVVGATVVHALEERSDAGSSE